MLEKEVEKRFCKAIKERGGMALKFESPGMAGVPDRLILMPCGSVAFAEIKAPNKKMRPLQLHRKAQLEALGFRVYLVDCMDCIERIADEIQTS